MAYILEPSTVAISTLQSINSTPLNVTTALQNLLAGNIIVVSSIDANTSNDTFIKLDLARTVPVTVETEEDPNSGTAFWSEYPIAVNDFSINSCYLYDKDLYKFSSFIRAGSIVKYKDSSTGLTDVATVKNCLKDSTGQLYYQLGNSDALYQLKQAGSVNGSYTQDGSIPFIPVADTTTDFTEIEVSDGEDKVFVLI
jgi:hypothetical protein